MSSNDLKNFLNALDTLKKSHICGICGEMCKEPVVLKKCFHWVCADHKGLTHCPNCNKPLDDAETFVDERLKRCIDYTNKLESIFEKFKPKDTDDSVNKQKSKNEEKPLTKSARLEEKRLKTSSKKLVSDTTNSRQDLSETIMSNMSSVIKSNEKRNLKGETALHVACRLGKIDKIQELLSSGANTNTKDNAGWTPLHEVVQNGRLDLVKLLLQYNTLINVPGQSNETPLHEAVRFNHSNIAEELVRNGADIHIRNCKGETPYQLASNDMKNLLLAAADNIVQTQGINISRISALYENLEFDDIHIYCLSEFRTVTNKLKLLSKHHSNIHIETKLNNKVTHMIVDSEERVCTTSLEILQGIVAHMWIISTEWVIKSTEKKLEKFSSYEILGIGLKSNNGPRNSRYNKYKQLPNIFNGCHFYFHNFNTKYEISTSLVLNKAILTKLVTDAGGVVLRRVPNPELIPESEKLVPYHASKGSKLYNCSHYIIFKDMYEPMYNMQHLKALPIGWLIECLEKYELCDP